MIAAEIAARWPGGSKKRGDWFDVRCSAAEHGGDERASLSLTDDHEKGRVRTVCRKACSFRSIVEGSPFTAADFFHAPAASNGKRHHAAAAVGRATSEAVYTYKDESGAVRSETVRTRRADGTKDFYQRRPDGCGGWINDLREIETTIYRLDTLAAEVECLPRGERFVAVVEGEKDVETLTALGIPATCNPMGAGKWRGHHSRQLVNVGADGAYVFRDADTAGEAHAEAVTRSLRAHDFKVKRVILPGHEVLSDKHGKDVTDWLQTHSPDELRAVLASSPRPTTDITPLLAVPTRWDAARPVADLVQEADEAVDWLYEPVLAPGSITTWFAPRGLGKTHAAYGIAVLLATQGKRVLLLDRDNSRREVRRRLRAWGAGACPTFKVMLREDVPPLTDAAAWAAFPLMSYDVVVVDSLDASTEGVGEKDSSKPSLAIAPLLDLAHRSEGPAILVLGNTIKSGEHSRGSGVVEDRIDVVYEVRDATDLKPTGTKDWWLELPQAGAGAWADRASRRKHRDTYRLAFTASKFRIGEEPDPFVLELDLSVEPWTFRNVTADVIASGETAKTQAQAERDAARAVAASALADDVVRRAAGAKPMLHGDAVDLLMEHGLSRKAAREVIAAHDGESWRRDTLTDVQGRPKVLLPLIKTEVTAETLMAADPHKQRGVDEGISAGRMSIGRQKHPPSESVKTAAIMRERFLPNLRESAAAVAVANSEPDDDMEDFRP